MNNQTWFHIPSQWLTFITLTKILLYPEVSGIATTMVIVFWYFLMVEQIFFSQQVKRSVIIGNKYDIYELPHELPHKLGS